MKIIAFGASSSKNSINKKLATYTSSLIHKAEVEILDLNDFEMPLFSEDKEREIGQPQEAKEFLEKIKNADGLVISFAEHNGSYTAAYKNLFDWASRIEQKVYQNKPTVYLSTSPGPGGASNVLKTAENSAPFFGVDLKGIMSVASFYDVFDINKGEMKDLETIKNLQQTIAKLKMD